MMLDQEKLLRKQKQGMETPQTWQELLRSIISDPAEVQRIAKEMKINPVTLNRWANQTSHPRLANVRALGNTIPSRYRQKMLDLLKKDFPTISLSSTLEQNIVPEIPSAFYSNIMNIYTTSPPILRSATICIAIFQQMLRQLDPLKQGMQILICQCLPPDKSEKVRSLRVTLGRATPPWEETHIETHTTLLGMESQAGSALIHGHPVITHSQKERLEHYPAHQIDYGESVAIYPLLYFDHVAGVLCVISTQPGHFTAAHLELLQSYTELLVLAFEPEEFYSFSDINLGIMPAGEVQQPYLDNFHARVTTIMLASERHDRRLKRAEAELLVWKELETTLLKLHPPRKS